MPKILGYKKGAFPLRKISGRSIKFWLSLPLFKQERVLKRNNRINVEQAQS